MHLRCFASSQVKVFKKRRGSSVVYTLRLCRRNVPPRNLESMLHEAATREKEREGFPQIVRSEISEKCEVQSGPCQWHSDGHCLNLDKTYYTYNTHGTYIYISCCIRLYCLLYLVSHGPYHDHDKRRPSHEMGSPQAANLQGLHVGTHFDQQRCSVVVSWS